MIRGRFLAVAMALVASLASAADGPRVKVIADMEKKPKYAVEWRKTKPLVAVSTLTASQGKRSLRIEHTGTLPRRACVTFPVPGGAAGYNTLAFDVYCAHDVHLTRLFVRLRQKPEAKGKVGVWDAVMRIRSFIDGWTTVRLGENAGLNFVGVRGAKPDWGKIEAVRFFLHDGGKSKTVLYLDNVRLEKVEIGKTRNMLFNSSFERTTVPDIPDGWGRDLAVPPYGEKVWGLDRTVAFKGKNSLRIGVPDKFARYWIKHLRATPKQTYTFSVYLRGEPGTKARLHIGGLRRATKNVSVGPTWQRYSVTATARGTSLYPVVTLLSGGPLWLDAAQLEAGDKATAWAPAGLDSMAGDDIAASAQKTRAPGGPRPKVAAVRAGKAPVIDGDLSDACWRDAAVLGPFLQLKRREPATPRTTARMVYDDDAIYVAVTADEPDMAGLREVYGKSARGPWGRDLVGMFLDLDHDKSSYYHFVGDLKGSRWEARYAPKAFFDASASAWRAEWRAAGKMGPKGWTFEAAIPYTALDLRPEIPVPGAIGLNVCRTDPRKRLYTSWSFTGGDFNLPAAFGTLTDFRPNVKPYRYDVGGLDWRRDRAEVAVANRTGADQTLKAVFTAAEPDGGKPAAAVTGRVGGGKSWVATAALPLRKNGPHEVRVRLYDRSGKLRYASQPIEVEVRGDFTFVLDGTEFDFYTREGDARARCYIETSAARLRGLKLRWAVERDGKALASGEANPRPGVNAWAFPLRKLPHGAYDVVATLARGDKVVARRARRFRRLPPAPHETRINQWGRFLVFDGKPWLWYGYYDALTRAKDPKRLPAALDDMKAANCTTVLMYTGSKVLDSAEVRRALDEAHKRGMKLWVHLGWVFGYCNPKYARRGDRVKTEAAAIAALRRIIPEFRAHPGLLGWCHLDEPGNRPTIYTGPYVLRFYRMIKELDPHHPCISSHLTRLGEVDIYGASSDLAMIPFSRERDPRANKLFREFWDRGFAISTNGPFYGAISGPREPTPEVVRVRIYKPTLMGARGFSSYTYRGSSMINWREITRIGAELRALAPVLLTPDDRLRVDVSPRGRDVIALLKKAKGKRYLFAVNVAKRPIKASFRLADAPGARKAKPLFGSPPAQLDAAARTLTVTMPPKSTAFYEVTR